MTRLNELTKLFLENRNERVVVYSPRFLSFWRSIGSGVAAEPSFRDVSRENRSNWFTREQISRGIDCPVAEVCYRRRVASVSRLSIDTAISISAVLRSALLTARRVPPSIVFLASERNRCSRVKDRLIGTSRDRRVSTMRSALDYLIARGDVISLRANNCHNSQRTGLRDFPS